MDNDIFGGTPLSGDVLNHNGYKYAAQLDPDYDKSYDPAHSIGLGYMWVSDDVNAPDVPYDKTKLRFISMSDDDDAIVTWELG